MRGSKQTAILLIMALALFGLSACDNPGSSRGTNAPIVPAGQQPIQNDNQIQFLKSLLRDDPKNVEALVKLGNIQMDSGKFDDAINSYSQALEIDPTNPNVRVDMGTCYRRVGLPETAVKEYKTAIKQDPNHMFAHRNLGVVYAYDLNRFAEAADMFEKYLELNPAEQQRKDLELEIKRLREAASQTTETQKN